MNRSMFARIYNDIIFRWTLRYPKEVRRKSGYYYDNDWVAGLLKLPRGLLRVSAFFLSMHEPQGLLIEKLGFKWSPEDLPVTPKTSCTSAADDFVGHPAV